MTIQTDNSESPGERIVVGVDGSPDARRAIQWAINHAQPADSIDLVHTWEQPEAGMVIDPSVLSESAAAMLNHELQLLKETNPNLPPLNMRTIHGHPGRALLEAAKDAELLVVGTRGHGGFTGLLLGSTSTYLAHHAPCPLVIVPASPHEE